MGLGSMMAGGNPDVGRGREVDDFYGTPKDVTKVLLLGPARDWAEDCVWEPCAGEGAMVDVLAKKYKTVVSSDVNPRRPDITKQDFFYIRNLNEINTTTIITNPPFIYAEEFIRHSFDVGITRMALVLKATFWHAKNRRPLWNKHRPSMICPLTWRPDFKGLKHPVMEVMWCIWDTPCTSTQAAYVPLSRD